MNNKFNKKDYCDLISRDSNSQTSVPGFITRIGTGVFFCLEVTQTGRTF